MIIALLQLSNVYVRSLALTHMTLLMLVDLYFLRGVRDLSIDQFVIEGFQLAWAIA